MKNIQKVFRKTMSLALCICLACAGLAGCSSVQDIVSGVTAGGVFPVEVAGVTIGARPSKVVVTSPSLADVVLALGYETQLAAGVEECTQDSLRDLVKIPKNDSQAILDVGPDLVLADPDFDSGVASALAESNVTVLTISPATDREDFERMYSQVASAFAGGEAGEAAGIAQAQDIFLVLDTINRIVPKDKVTTACYLYDLEGRAVTGDMLGSTIMSYAGVTNVFKSEIGGAFSFESLEVFNPNLIFCPPEVAEQIKSDSRFAKFQAVQNGKVVEMDESLMQRQGRTVIEAAYEISGAAYPELLEENSMEVTDPTERIDSEVSSAMESSASELEEEEPDDTTYVTLQEGDQGEDVLKLQTRLDELGYLDVEYDGHYGAYTAGCVKEFQEANGLEANGISDEKTQRKLFSKKAVAKKSAE